jgi:hypothetical protein
MTQQQQIESSPITNEVDAPMQSKRSSLSGQELLVELIPAVFASLNEHGFRDGRRAEEALTLVTSDITRCLQIQFGLEEGESLRIAEKSILWTTHVARNSALDRQNLGWTPDGSVMDDSLLGLDCGFRFLERTVVFEARNTELFPQATRSRTKRQNLPTRATSPNDAPVRNRLASATPNRRATTNNVQQHFTYSEENHYHFNNNQPPRSMLSAAVVLLLIVIMVLFYTMLAFLK